MTSPSSRIERVVPVVLRPASGVITMSGLIVVSLAVAEERLDSPVGAVVVLLVGIVAVVGGAIRLACSPRLWGRGSAAWSAAAAMSLAGAHGIGMRFPATLVIASGVATSLALALLVIAASAARRDRRPPASRR